MEVAHLTYRLYRFLKKRKWSVIVKPDDNKFIFLYPDKMIELPDDYVIKLPIDAKSNEYYLHMKNIIEIIASVYINDSMELQVINQMNENLKFRFTKRWIIPEENSRIRKISKYELYFSNKL